MDRLRRWDQNNAPLFADKAPSGHHVFFTPPRCNLTPCIESSRHRSPRCTKYNVAQDQSGRHKRTPWFCIAWEQVTIDSKRYMTQFRLCTRATVRVSAKRRKADGTDGETKLPRKCSRLHGLQSAAMAKDSTEGSNDCHEFLVAFESENTENHSDGFESRSLVDSTPAACVCPGSAARTLDSVPFLRKYRRRLPKWSIIEFLIVVAVVFVWEYVFHNPLCSTYEQPSRVTHSQDSADLLFKCGCTWNWAGGWDDCNVHNVTGPRCPWYVLIHGCQRRDFRLVTDRNAGVTRLRTSPGQPTIWCTPSWC